MEYLYDEAEFNNLLTQLELNTDLAFEALDHSITLSLLIEEPDTPQNRMGKEIIKDKINDLFNTEVVVSMEALTVQDAKDFGRRALRAISDFVKRIITWVKGLFNQKGDKLRESIEETTNALTEFREAARQSDLAIKRHNLPVNEKLSKEMKEFVDGLGVEIMIDGEGKIQLSEYFYDDMTRRIVKRRADPMMFGIISDKGNLVPTIQILGSHLDNIKHIAGFGYPEPLTLYVQRLFGVHSEQDIPYLRDDRVNQNNTWVNQTISRLGLNRRKDKWYTGPTFNKRVYTHYTVDRIGKVPMLILDTSGSPNNRQADREAFKGSIKHARRPISDLEQMIKYQIEFLAIRDKIDEDHKRLSDVMEQLYVKGRGESIAEARANIERVIAPVNPELANELVTELKVSHTRLSRALSVYAKMSDLITLITSSSEYYFRLMVDKENVKLS